MSFSPDKPRKWRPGQSIKASDLNKIVEQVLSRLAGSGGAATSYYGDRAIVNSDFSTPTLPGITNYVTQYMVLTEYDDYLKCTPWNPPDNGEVIIPQVYEVPASGIENQVPIVYVAKPFWLQKTPWNNKTVTINGVATTYSYTALDVRNATTVGGTISEILFPSYAPGDIVTAVNCSTGLSEPNGGPNICWADLNAGGRVWKKGVSVQNKTPVSEVNYTDISVFTVNPDNDLAWSNPSTGTAKLNLLESWYNQSDNLLTCTASVSAGLSRTITPVQGNLISSQGWAVDDLVLLDVGADAEIVRIAAVTETTFTADCLNNHDGTVTPFPIRSLISGVLRDSGSYGIGAGRLLESATGVDFKHLYFGNAVCAVRSWTGTTYANSPQVRIVRNEEAYANGAYGIRPVDCGIVIYTDDSLADSPWGSGVICSPVAYVNGIYFSNQFTLEFPSSGDYRLNRSTLKVSMPSYLTSPVGAVNGGTGITTYTTGDILYASATNTLSKLPIGANGMVLTISSGLPVWDYPYSDYVPNSGWTEGDLLYANATGDIIYLLIGSEDDILTVQSGVPVWTDSISLAGATLGQIQVDGNVLLCHFSGTFGVFGAYTGTQQAAQADVSGSAGGTYTSTEQDMINDLATAVNNLLAGMRAFGFWAT